jgi:hypothetical protein
MTMPASKLASNHQIAAASTVGPAPTPAVAIGASVVNKSNQDLLQVASRNGGAIVWRLDFSGVVHTAPSVGVPTPTALLGKYEGNSFSDAFPQLNGATVDFLQISNGSQVVFRIDSSGISHSNS